MKYAWVQWTLIALASITAARCIKHLIHLGEWESLGFVLFKDLAMAILVIYFFRLSRGTHAQEKFEMRNLAVLSMKSLLAVSFFSDTAFTVMR